MRYEICVYICRQKRKDFFINVEIKCFFEIKMIVFFKKVENFFDECDQFNNKVIYYVRINYLIMMQIVYNYEELIVN